MKDLLQRYLAAVERRLPPKEAKDIVAELRQAIDDKIEAKEEELGRPVGKDDVIAIIKSFGSPMLAAGRYNSKAQYLIGPDVYPYFWPTARIVVGIVAAVAIIGFLVEGVLSDEPMRHGLAALGAAWNASLIAFAVVTASFIAIDRTKASHKFEEKWRPDQLPRFDRNKPKTLLESLFSLVWDAIFISWWVGFVRFPNTVPTETGLTFDLNTAAWAAVYWPVLAMAAMAAALHIADIVHPAWSRIRSVAAIAVILTGLGSVWMLAQEQARSGQLIAVHGSADVAARAAELNESFATVSQVLLIGLAIGFGLALVVEGWRLVRSLQAGAGPSAVPASNGG